MPQPSLVKQSLLLAALLLPACFANAHDYKAGELQIAHPWSQELPPNAPTVAAYFVVHNRARTPTPCSVSTRRSPVGPSCMSTSSRAT